MRQNKVLEEESLTERKYIMFEVSEEKDRQERRNFSIDENQIPTTPPCYW